jgi:hypothetical protein
MSIKGTPKGGEITAVGHEGTHGGVSVHAGGMVSGYPRYFAMLKHKKPESSKEPPDQSKVLRKRRYSG